MAREFTVSSCEIFDSKKQYIDIVGRAREAGIVKQYKSKKSEHSLRFEYILVSDLNELFGKQILKPEIEDWTYGTRKMNGKNYRMYYRELWTN
jgi:hypothetical protein